MNLSNVLGNLGIIFFLVCCAGFLISIFLIGPLPYIISAAVLKIEKRGYWKAFGTFILGGLAGGVISAIITFIFSAITGGMGAFSLNDINNILPFLMTLLSRMWLVSLISAVASILVQMAITGGLYGVSFGKGALIWLLGLVFSILITIVLVILAVVLSTIGVLPSFNDLGNQLQQMIPGITY
jgi:hypothetical protein